MHGSQDVGKQRFQPGGSRDTPKSLRQVAFGVAFSSIYRFQEVAGRQTVPRAERWGSIQVLSRVDPVGGPFTNGSRDVRPGRPFRGPRGVVYSGLPARCVHAEG